MPIHDIGERLRKLRHLRDRVDDEIARLEDQRTRIITRRPRPPATPKPPSDAEVRAWARAQGIPGVPPTGRISTRLRNSYTATLNNTQKASTR